MAREVFMAVETAENKADQLIQEAQRYARELLKTAESEITTNERKIALEHRVMAQSILDEKRASVQSNLTANRPAALAMQETSLLQARSRLEQAAQRIFERVWNDGNR